MHPDAIIEALQHELEGCNDQQRKKEIREEIKAMDAQERVAIVSPVTEPVSSADFQRSYLDALREEAERSGKDRQKEIKAEISRVEADLKPKREPKVEQKEEPVSEQPTQEEIEQRREARTGQGVEQARSAPVPGQAPPAETVPAEGAEAQAAE